MNKKELIEAVAEKAGMSRAQAARAVDATLASVAEALSKDEIALSKKLIDIDTEFFYCIDCLADNIGCTIEDLQEKIQEFKEQGCTLFL